MKTKWCSSCKTDKDVKRFAKNKARPDGLFGMCRDCKKSYNATYYQATKDRHNPGRAVRREAAMAEAQLFVYEYLLGHPCVDCGEADVLVLDFDHQRDKLANVSEMIRDGYPVSRILAEIEKCEVVCANDHRRRTARMFGWYKFVRAANSTAE